MLWLSALLVSEIPPFLQNDALRFANYGRAADNVDDSALLCQALAKLAAALRSRSAADFVGESAAVKKGY